MPCSRPSCPICGESNPARIRKVVIQGRDFFLCQPHANEAVHAMPKTIDALQELFRTEAAERRSPVSRRAPRQPDRRTFPRPEGRRMGFGRRATDLSE